MGVLRFEKEIPASVAPSRMFKAFILDSHNLLPKLMPQAFKSIDIMEGDRGVGTIKVTNFGDATQHKYTKQRIDALDEDNFTCKYTIIEGDGMDIFESIVYDIKFVTSDNGGCVCKTITECHTKGDQEIKEEAFKENEEKAVLLYKFVEAHLVANPQLYA